MLDENSFLDELVLSKRTVVIRLREGRDVSGIIAAHDAASLIIVTRDHKQRSLVYKGAISVITPVPEE